MKGTAALTLAKGARDAWAGLWQLGSKRAAGQANAEDAAMADDLTISDPARIGSVLGAMATARMGLAVTAPEAAGIGAGRLLAAERGALWLRALWPRRDAPSAVTRFTLAGTTPMGVIVFSPIVFAAAAEDVWTGAAPEEILRIQSRRFRRVSAVNGRAHRARIDVAGMAEPVRLLDLSEGGAGLLVRTPHWADAETLRGARLHADGEAIDLPTLRVVHSTPLARGAWRVGVAFEEVAPAAERFLRRWLNAVEAEAVAASRLLQPEARSNR